MNTQAKTFATTDMEGTTVYGIVQHRPDCFSVTCLGYTPNVPLTPEQQAEAEAEAAQYAKYEAEFEALYGNRPAPDPDCYTTAEAARRATALRDSLNCMSQDLAAFNAPSECYGDAMNPYIAELDALEEKYGTRLNPPTLGEQYADAASKTVPGPSLNCCLLACATTPTFSRTWASARPCKNPPWAGVTCASPQPRRSNTMSRDYYGADYFDDEEFTGEPDFADPGGNSALRAATKSNPRNLPCPTCGQPDRLTPADKARGYQCDACADRDERGGEY